MRYKLRMLLRRASLESVRKDEGRKLTTLSGGEPWSIGGILHEQYFVGWQRRAGAGDRTCPLTEKWYNSCLTCPWDEIHERRPFSSSQRSEHLEISRPRRAKRNKKLQKKIRQWLFDEDWRHDEHGIETEYLKWRNEIKIDFLAFFHKKRQGYS